jgi:hypothetical protein
MAGYDWLGVPSVGNLRHDGIIFRIYNANIHELACEESAWDLSLCRLIESELNQGTIQIVLEEKFVRREPTGNDGIRQEVLGWAGARAVEFDTEARLD